ncbi:MAG: glycosyltransferase family A protein [Thermoanaerobaculia bacterium]
MEAHQGSMPPDSSAATPSRGLEAPDARTLGSPMVPGLVSVIVPIFNRQELVATALDSILEQTYRSLEIVAVDDGSTDGTQEILDSYAARFPDLITVIRQPNSGPAVARNRALGQARGEFIAFLDSDDVWLPSKLELQLPRFAPEVGLVYSALQEVDADGRVLTTVHCDQQMRGDVYRHLLVRNRMTGGTVVIRRSVLETVGVFDESLRAAENWDLWIRISKAFAVDFVDQPLLQYQKHEDRLSLDRPRMQAAAEAVLAKHFPEPPAEGDPLLDNYNRAYANIYYRRGVNFFSAANYPEARQMFRRCWEYCPGYRDSRVRYARALLAAPANSLLSRLKRSVSR